MARRGELALKEEDRLIAELPAGCGPLDPTLADIFERAVSEEELREADDEETFSEISRESKLLTALGFAAPTEVVAHTKVRQFIFMTLHYAPLYFFVICFAFQNLKENFTLYNSRFGRPPSC